MNPTSPTAGTYNPTPMEQAYGLYLLEQVFPTSLASFKANTTIQISGKDAVAFLTTSGIHRLILRHIWNVADPQNFGSLTQISQFHTIIRLVGLTQAGQVESKLLAVGSMKDPKPTPVQVLHGILQQTVGTIVPLATFQGVAVPLPDQLQVIFQQQQTPSAFGSLSPTRDPFASMDAPHVRSKSVSPTPPWSSSSPAQAPRPQSTSPTPTWPSQQQQPSAGTSALGMDAFDALAGGVQDQPLPSLGGGFGQGQSPPKSTSNLPSPTQTQFGGNNAGGFGGGIQPSSSFPGAATKNNTGNVAEDDDDDFGGFTDAPAPTSNNNTNDFMGMDAFDALAPAIDDPFRI